MSILEKHVDSNCLSELSVCSDLTFCIEKLNFECQAYSRLQLDGCKCIGDRKAIFSMKTAPLVHTVYNNKKYTIMFRVVISFKLQVTGTALCVPSWQDSNDFRARAYLSV
jgi:hypothetical protein